MKSGENDFVTEAIYQDINDTLDFIMRYRTVFPISSEVSLNLRHLCYWKIKMRKFRNFRLVM